MPDAVRILLVDDEVVVLETYSLLLEKCGYYVKAASRPQDAVELMYTDNFDVVFIDHFLGRVKGLDLIPQMAKIDPGVFFVMMTGNSSTDLAVESLKNGATDFISKPFQLADLVKSIDYVGKKKELERQRKEMQKEIMAILESKVDEKTEELRSVYFSVLSTLAQTMEKKDMGTYGHCRRVSNYCEIIATAIGLDRREKEDLSAAAMLHDIGKIGISDFILGKQGILNVQEVETVKSHPQKGVEILAPLSQFKAILPAILHHHEKYDGSGYPYGLSGEEIPLQARIIAIADTYDAILSDRPYRSGANNDKAIDELSRCAGSQFDPRIVEVIRREGLLNAADNPACTA